MALKPKQVPLPSNVQVDPDSGLGFKTLPDGSMELLEEEELQPLQEMENPLQSILNGTSGDEGEDPYDALLGINLADSLEEDDIQEITNKVIEGLQDDLDSLKDHFATLKDGVDLLGLSYQEHGELGEWSCGATHPLIIENAVKLQATAENELDHPDGPFKTRIFGANASPEAEGVAKRKQDYLNWLITTKSDSFTKEASKAYLLCSIFGTSFKGNHWDPVFKEIDSVALKPDQLITHWETKSLRKAHRYTVIRPSSDLEVQQKMQQGIFRQIDIFSPSKEEDKGSVDVSKIEASASDGLASTLAEVTGVTYDNDRVILHMYTYLDAKELLHEQDPLDELEDEFEDVLKEEGIEEGEEKDEDVFQQKMLPFIISVELHSGKVLSIYANWRQGDTNYIPKCFYTDYHFIHGFGFYSLGYIHILGSFQKMLTSIMRSLVDAGTFANLPGGFRLKGGMKTGGSIEISPGEFVEIETTAQDISKAIMALPFKEPSAVLSNMYSVLESRGQMFANATEGVVNDSTNYGKVGTTLALLDASSKLTTSIIRRFHASRRRELEIIEELVKENVEAYPYPIEGIEDLQKTFQEDFSNELVEIVPVSDPNIPNSAERKALAQQRIQFIQQFPQVHDVRAALYQVYKTLGDEAPEKILPSPEQAKPQDPMSDILAAVNGKPIQAFPGQAHQAYIQVFNSWINNPETMSSPLMAPAINAVTALVKQHMIMDYQEKIQAMTSGAATDPQTVAMLQAQAAQQLTQQAQQMQQMQANAQDPSFLMAKVQEQKANNDAARQDSKEKIEFARLALEDKRVELEREKLDNQRQISDNKIRADLVNADEERKAKRGKDSADFLSARTNKALDILAKAAFEDGKAEKEAANILKEQL